jgi:hypothetical protein
LLGQRDRVGLRLGGILRPLARVSHGDHSFSTSLSTELRYLLLYCSLLPSKAPVNPDWDRIGRKVQPTS